MVTSLEFEAALDNAEDNASCKSLLDLTKAVDQDFLIEHGPNLASRMLTCIADTRIPNFKRRWIGVALNHFITSSTKILNHVQKLTNDLQRLGHSMLSLSVQDDFRLVVGMNLRKLAAKNNDSARFFGTDDIPPFPIDEDTPTWMGKFQDFIDRLDELKFMPTGDIGFVLYAQAITASDGLRLMRSTAAITVFIEKGRFTAAVSDPRIGSGHLTFVDVPFDSMRTIQFKKTALYDSQGQAAEHQPTDLVIGLSTDDWSYLYDAEERTAESITITLRNIADAQEAMSGLPYSLQARIPSNMDSSQPLELSGGSQSPEAANEAQTLHSTLKGQPFEGQLNVPDTLVHNEGLAAIGAAIVSAEDPAKTPQAQAAYPFHLPTGQADSFNRPIRFTSLESEDIIHPTVFERQDTSAEKQGTAAEHQVGSAEGGDSFARGVSAGSSPVLASDVVVTSGVRASTSGVAVPTPAPVVVASAPVAGNSTVAPASTGHANSSIAVSTSTASKSTAAGVRSGATSTSASAQTSAAAVNQAGSAEDLHASPQIEHGPAKTQSSSKLKSVKTKPSTRRGQPVDNSTDELSIATSSQHPAKNGQNNRQTRQTKPPTASSKNGVSKSKNVKLPVTTRYSLRRAASQPPDVRRAKSPAPNSVYDVPKDADQAQAPQTVEHSPSMDIDKTEDTGTGGPAPKRGGRKTTKGRNPQTQPTKTPRARDTLRSRDNAKAKSQQPVRASARLAKAAPTKKNQTSKSAIPETSNKKGSKSKTVATRTIKANGVHIPSNSKVARALYRAGSSQQVPQTPENPLDVFDEGENSQIDHKLSSDPPQIFRSSPPPFPSIAKPTQLDHPSTIEEVPEEGDVPDSATADDVAMSGEETLRADEDIEMRDLAEKVLPSSSHSSTSIDTSRLPSSVVEDDEMDWEASLTGSQQTVVDHVRKLVNRSLRHIVLNEEACRTMVQGFADDGTSLIKSLKKSQEEPLAVWLSNVETEKRSLGSDMHNIANAVKNSRVRNNQGVYLA